MPSPCGDDALTAIAAGWVGVWNNHRQIAANLKRGGSPAPELSRERRQMRVVQLQAPQLGERVLFFEELRASRPGLAHRQRVVTLELEPGDASDPVPVARQLFFREGPAYDRPPLEPVAVARLAPQAFRREAGCDLVFRWEAQHRRWRGTMRPCACRYHHPESGLVYADFEMLLLPDQLWYRDRSLHLPEHTIRGEVDGFSWLLFDRLASDGAVGWQGAVGLQSPASLAASYLGERVGPGVYQGSFRRYSAAGELIETLASEVVIRVQEQDGELLYSQTNLYRSPDGSEQRLESQGTIEADGIRFRNDRVEGWCQPVESDGPERTFLLVLRYSDGSGRRLQEHIVVSADGGQRARVAQHLINGQLAGRTLIDERKVSADWRAWDRDHPLP